MIIAVKLINIYIFSPNYFCVYVCYSIIHNSQDMETT